MENIGIFYGHLEHILAIGYIILPFGNQVVFWYIFPRFGALHRDKSGNPDVLEFIKFSLDVKKGRSSFADTSDGCSVQRRHKKRSEEMGKDRIKRTHT
jgi:hypothetical protein